MKGDFSRLTFDPSKQFTQVLMQQGRVQLDADWNEQAAILLHYLKRLAGDLIGPYGGPEGDLGFEVEPVHPNGGNLTDLKIKKGRYYVDGLLCENPADTMYKEDHRRLVKDALPDDALLVYLDVWERHVTHLEEGSIREVALGGPDTATRAQVVWQVRIADTLPDGQTRISNRPESKLDWREWVDARWQVWVDSWQPPHRGSLKARAKTADDPTDLCLASPEARYRGPENQLYRVEIHTGGQAGSGATFKWSRDNGSVVFPIVSLATGSAAGRTIVRLEHLGHESRPGLAPGDRVEVVDGAIAPAETLGPMIEVAEVDADRLQVTLAGMVPEEADESGQTRAPGLLRRWDHGRSKGSQLSDGAVPLVEGEESWLDLEDGVQVAFEPTNPAHVYRRGDYWLIPARTATGDIEWPGSPEAPGAQPPHGVRHRYAPLALVRTDQENVVDLRRSFGFLAQPLA